VSDCDLPVTAEIFTYMTFSGEGGWERRLLYCVAACHETVTSETDVLGVTILF